jgi:hypothetical protein
MTGLMRNPGSGRLLEKLCFNCVLPDCDETDPKCFFYKEHSGKKKYQREYKKERRLDSKYVENEYKSKKRWRKL